MHVLYTKQKTRQNGLASFIVQSPVPAKFLIFQARLQVPSPSFRTVQHQTRTKAQFCTKKANSATLQVSTPTTTRDHPVTTRLKSPSVAGSISCCTILTSRQPTGRHVPPKTCCLEKTWKWIITCLSCLEIIRITVSHGNRPKFCAFFSHTKHQHNPGGKRRVGATVSELDMAWNDCEGRQHAIYYNTSTFQETAF